MTILIHAYIALIIFNTISMPFLFGKARTPYTPKGWLLQTIVNLPLVYVLLELTK